jgi:hypothetical protein
MFGIWNSPPKMQTEQAITMIAMIAPLDRVNDPPSGPDAPASLSPLALPAEDPTSPAVGPGYNQYCALYPFLFKEEDSPFPGCSGAEVARLENTEATELEDISGVRETTDVGVG